MDPILLQHLEKIKAGDIKHRFLEPFEFEKIDNVWAVEWIQKHQTTVSYIAVGYIFAILLGRAWMKDRKPFGLRTPLIIWNWALAIFSFCGFIRTAPTFIYLLMQPQGYYKSACDRDYFNEPEFFWGFLFAISKVFELVDTAFIILRKAPLLFLHWFHHLTMVAFLFYLFPVADPVARWVAIVNYGVHSVMYSYYALKVMRIKIPKFVSIVITTMQMSQFIASFIATMFAVYKLYSGTECILSRNTLTINIVGCISYFSLFANYFYQTYFNNKTKSA